jgi:hypothetical protein
MIAKVKVRLPSKREFAFALKQAQEENLLKGERYE